jgi:hypothetical protein
LTDTDQAIATDEHPDPAPRANGVRLAPDDILKAATVAFGSFYVLGLIVANTHLLNLDVSDFSAFHPRLVMTGALFALYFGLVLLAIALLVILPQLTYSNLPIPRLLKLVSVIVATACLGYFFCLFAITYTTAFYAVPFAPVHGFVATYKFVILELGSGPSYSFLAFLLLALIWLTPARNFVAGNLGLQLMSIGLLILGFGSLLVQFADDVYPRLKYNLGGGQPQIAQIFLDGGADAKTLPGKPPGVFVNELPNVCDGATPAPNIEAAVIWYQSEKFIYFSTWPKTEGIKVIALDSKAIKLLRFLPVRVTMGRGGRIEGLACTPKT